MWGTILCTITLSNPPSFVPERAQLSRDDLTFHSTNGMGLCRLGCRSNCIDPSLKNTKSRYLDCLHIRRSRFPSCCLCFPAFWDHGTDVSPDEDLLQGNLGTSRQQGEVENARVCFRSGVFLNISNRNGVNVAEQTSQGLELFAHTSTARISLVFHGALGYLR